MRFFNRTENPNLFIGLFMLVLLAVFAGPNTLPRVLSFLIPNADEGVPCVWLRQGIDRGDHQSLIGRAAEDPIALRVKSSPIPSTPDGRLVISIIVINQSLGTVPFIYNPDQVIVGDDGTSGLGITFTPSNSLTSGASRQDFASYPENNIRLLGPRQRCVHKLEFPLSALDSSVASGSAQVRAYYRNNNPGQVTPPPNTLATPIYTDQGLWTGFMTSDPVQIPVAAQ